MCPTFLEHSWSYCGFKAEKKTTQSTLLSKITLQQPITQLGFVAEGAFPPICWFIFRWFGGGGGTWLQVLQPCPCTFFLLSFIYSKTHQNAVLVFYKRHIWSSCVCAKRINLWILGYASCATFGLSSVDTATSWIQKLNCYINLSLSSPMHTPTTTGWRFFLVVG